VSFVRFDEANDYLRFDCSDAEYAAKLKEDRLRAQAWAVWANRWYQIEAPGDPNARPPYDPEYPTRAEIVNA
jgi:hypothetical protein